MSNIANLGNFPHTIGNLDDRPNLTAAQMKAAFEQDVMTLWGRLAEAIPYINSILPLSSLVDVVNSSSTDNGVPTAKAVYDAIVDASLGGSAQQIIDDWLDAHPEATTTVTDGAITNAKLATSFTTPGVATAYSSSNTYAVGDYVFQSGSLYRCISAISTAEVWTPAHWKQVNIGVDVSKLASDSDSFKPSFASTLKQTQITFTSIEEKDILYPSGLVDDNGSEHFMVSERIDVSNYKIVYIDTSMQYNYAVYAFYDSNDDPIFGTAYTLNSGSTIASFTAYVYVPTGAKYLRIGRRGAAGTVIGYSAYDINGIESDISGLTSESADIKRSLIGSLKETPITFASVSGKDILYPSGEVGDNASEYFMVSTAIDVSHCPIVYINTTMQFNYAVYAFYDADDEPISGTAYTLNSGSTIGTFSDYVYVPTGAKYLRIGRRGAAGNVIGYMAYGEEGYTALDEKKVDYPQDQSGKPVYGNDGQVLRSKGNGKTEWAAVGMPTDEQITEIFENWLTEHPEATTTVQDHSLSYEKLINGTFNFVTPEMYGAVGDGVADDTDAIQDALDSGNAVWFGTGKTYLVSVQSGDEYALDVPSNITIFGNNAKVKLIANALSSCQILRINRKDNVHIYSLNIIGDKDDHEPTAGELCEGIKIIAGTNISLFGCSISESFGDGIRVTWTGNKNIYINSCVIHDCGRNGISVEDADNLVIIGCTIYDIDRTAPKAAIDVEPYQAGSVIKHLSISNCVCSNAGHLGYVVQLGSVVSGCDVSFNNCEAINAFNILYNSGEGNKVSMSGCNLGRLGIVQTDDSSSFAVRDTNIYINEDVYNYYNEGVTLDFTGSREIAPLNSITDIYNVVCDVVLHGINNASRPVGVRTTGGNVSYITRNGCVFTLSIVGEWNDLSHLKLLQEIADVEYKKRTTFITADNGASGGLSLIDFRAVDNGSVCGGNYSITDLLENQTYSITAGDDIASDIHLVFSGTAADWTVTYLDSTSADIAAGKTVFLKRLGSDVYVSKR